MNSARSAWTLLETLISMAIIGVVAGIVLSSLSGAQAVARGVRCGAQLRSIGVAMAGHLEASQERFPVARYMPRPWFSVDPNKPLPAALATYLEPDSPVWRCPGDVVVAQMPYEEQGSLLQSGTSYMYHSLLSGLRLERSSYGWSGLMASTAPVVNDFDGGTFALEDESEVTVDFFHRRREVLYADGHADVPAS